MKQEGDSYTRTKEVERLGFLVVKGDILDMFSSLGKPRDIMKCYETYCALFMLTRAWNYFGQLGLLSKTVGQNNYKAYFLRALSQKSDAPNEMDLVNPRSRSVSDGSRYPGSKNSLSVRLVGVSQIKVTALSKTLLIRSCNDTNWATQIQCFDLNGLNYKKSRLDWAWDDPSSISKWPEYWLATDW